ncbi:MAG: hypothetical protein KZQ86_04450, partial [Candidatus Thiodiazotropha sp. (ex Lucinoma kastoroae)]|nr:hypothetical protein [Candidatus Thiodiazotropha sp. (ex Lucinoma kastoroae)]
GDYTLQLTVMDDRGGVSTDDVIITFNPYMNSTDDPPNAEAGVHYKTSFTYLDLRWGDELTLAGNTSTDSGGSIVSYEWQQMAGPKTAVTNPTSSYTTFVPEPFDGSATSVEPIEYRFLLTVIDNDGNRDEDFVIHQVWLKNSEPFAIFKQQPLISLAGSTIQLDATKSFDYDPNDYISSYHWSQYTGPAVTFLDNSAQPLVQLPDADTVTGKSNFGIELSVTDLYDTDTRFPKTHLFWVVAPDYQANLFSAGDDIYVQAGTQVTITGEPYVPAQCNPITGCVDDSADLYWKQLAGPQVELLQNRGWTMSFTAPPVTERAEMVFGLAKIVPAFFGNRSVIDVDPVTVYLLPQGAALTADAGQDQESLEKNLLTLDGSDSFDPAGTIERYHWEQLEGPQAFLSAPNGMITEVALPALAEGADLLFQLTVVNDWDMEAIDSIRIRVNPDLTDGDIDADGVHDDNDLFPQDPNEAYDVDGDGIGDNGDGDIDGDGVDNDTDFYPNDPQDRPLPQLTVSEPADGAEIGADYVIVRGTVDAPENTGVTVNGIVAERGGEPYGHEFIAKVPLAEGSNELTIMATTLSRKQVSQTLTVNRSGESPVSFFVSESSGFAPLENRLSFHHGGVNPVLQVDIDYDGDGGIDQTLVDNFDQDLIYTYDTEGLYTPQITVTDADGMQYTLTQLVNVVAEGRILTQLEDHWSHMNNALSEGNLGLALEHIGMSRSEKYGRFFRYLLPKMPEIVASYSPLQVNSLAMDHASVHVVRSINDENRVFTISFNQDIFGVWRIIGM